MVNFTLKTIISLYDIGYKVHFQKRMLNQDTLVVLIIKIRKKKSHMQRKLPGKKKSTNENIYLTMKKYIFRQITQTQKTYHT